MLLKSFKELASKYLFKKNEKLFSVYFENCDSISCVISNIKKTVEDNQKERDRLLFLANQIIENKDVK